MGSSARPGASAIAGLALRAATSADLVEVVALERTCYRDPWPFSAFASLPDNARVYFAVAELDGRAGIAGYVIAWHVMDEGELANLAVAPDLRGRGIGRAMLDAMLNDASVRGISQVYLEVRESNVAARKLYASRGFDDIGRRKGYYRSPVEDALILRRTIRP